MACNKSKPVHIKTMCRTLTILSREQSFCSFSALFLQFWLLGLIIYTIEDRELPERVEENINNDILRLIIPFLPFLRNNFRDCSKDHNLFEPTFSTWFYTHRFWDYLNTIISYPCHTMWAQMSVRAVRPIKMQNISHTKSLYCMKQSSSSTNTHTHTKQRK